MNPYIIKTVLVYAAAHAIHDLFLIGRFGYNKGKASKTPKQPTQQAQQQQQQTATA